MDTDILILGAGPSGLSTALHLAQLDPRLATRVLVLEKERHPRPKLCAGGLVADAEIILERLGLDTDEVPHVDASAARFDFAGAGLKVTLPKRRALRIIRRDEFDAWLARKAGNRGIEIREGVTVKDVRPDSDGVTVITDAGDFRARVVVGADGSNGVTRRCVLPNAPVYTARALEVLTPTEPVTLAPGAGAGVASRRRPERSVAQRCPEPVEGSKDGGKAISYTARGLLRRSLRSLLAMTKLRNDGHKADVAYFDFFPVPSNIAGYVWDFPTQLKGQPMRCWGVYDTNILADGNRPPLKEPLAKEMARHGFSLGDYEIKGHPIRWFDPFNPLSVPRVLLVGDAAGVDPLFGEGISPALGYGFIAARAIRDALARGDFSFGDYRQRVLRSSLGQTLAARWFVARAMYKLKWKWFQFLLWRILKPLVIAGAWVFVLNWAKRMPFKKDANPEGME